MGRRKNKNKKRMQTSILYSTTPSIDDDFDLDNFTAQIENLMSNEKERENIINKDSVSTKTKSKIFNKKYIKDKCLSFFKNFIYLNHLLLKTIFSFLGREFVRMTAFSVLFTAIITAAGVSSFFIYRELHDSRAIQAKKMFQMENKFNEFRHIKSYQLHADWINVLNKKREQENKVFYNSISVLFEYYGGSLNCSDYDLSKKLNAFLEVQLTKTILNYSQIKPGDFLVFRTKWINGKSYNRVCIIEEYVGGVIKYLDYDNGLGTLSYSINSNDYNIEKVVECSFPIWAGINIHNGIYITRGKKLDHSGIDVLIANNDRSVLSFSDGYVITAFNNYDHSRRWEKQNTGGNYCIVKTTLYGETRYLQYLHLKNLKVRKNTKIKKGDYIGEYDDLGYSFGKHLHLAMFDKVDKNGILANPRDPLPLLFENSAFILYNKYFNYEEILRV